MPAPADLQTPPVRDGSPHGCVAPIVNVSGYRFTALDGLSERRANLHAALLDTGVLGTVLLAGEGINVSLAGDEGAIGQAVRILDEDVRLAGLWLKRSVSTSHPFSKLKVRIRREIIAFDGDAVPCIPRPDAPRVAPATLRRWLDGERNVRLLDTRNDYEIEAGGFARATSLGIGHFRDFKAAVETALADGRLRLDEPLVTFCTGGIRCEKAAPWLLERGFDEVHQIEGGILNWLEREGDAHWSGDCFVFDDRVSLTPALGETGATLCPRCHRAVPAGEACRCDERHGSRTASDTV